MEMYWLTWALLCHVTAAAMDSTSTEAPAPPPPDMAFTEPYPATAAALFVPDGNAVFTANTWDVVVDLPLSGLKQNLDNLENITNNWNLSSYYTVQNHTALTSLIQEARQAFYQLSSFEPDYLSLNSSVHARRKRGLFDTGGDIMWALFGTARQNDLDDLSTKINRLSNTDEALIHAYENQLTFLRQMAEHVNAEDKRITDTVKAVETLHNVTEQIHEQVASNTAALRKAAKLSVYSQIISALNYFRNRITELHFAVHQIDLGYLDSNFLAPRKLYEILQTIPMKPGRFHLVTEVSLQSIRKLYQWKICTRIPTPSTIRVLIRIPLTTTEETFSVYRVVPFPIRLPGDQHRTKLVTPVKRVAMTPTRSKFVVLDEEAMASCVKGSVLICPQTHAYMIAQDRHCLFAMLNAKAPRYDYRCTYERLLPTETEVLPLTSVRWAVSAMVPEKFQISCMQEVQGLDEPTLVAIRSIEIVGNAILHLPMHCQAKSSDWELPLRLETTGSVTLALSEQQYFSPPMPSEYELIGEPVETTNSSREIQTLLKITHAYLKTAASSPNGTLDVKLLDKAYEDFQRSLEFHEQSGLTLWRIFTRILQGIGFILFVIAIYYLRQKCKSWGQPRPSMIFEPIPMHRRSRRRPGSSSPSAV